MFIDLWCFPHKKLAPWGQELYFVHDCILNASLYLSFLIFFYQFKTLGQARMLSWEECRNCIQICERECCDHLIMSVLLWSTNNVCCGQPLCTRLKVFPPTPSFQLKCFEIYSYCDSNLNLCAKRPYLNLLFKMIYSK